ncbi:MAG: glycosyltransferase family 39 protein [Limisphaerales bacterium]
MNITTILPKIRNRWLAILGLLLFFIVLRWNSFNAPLIRDEGEYAYGAQLLMQGVAPYEHAFIQKPPMVIYSYALSHLLLPQFFWAPRLLAALFAALATILLGYIARLEFGKGFAWPAMWLVTPMILLPQIEEFIANTEMFMLLPLMAMVALYVHSRHCGQKLKYWFAAGFMGVTTVCYKYTALPVLAFVYIFWLIELWQGSRKLNILWRFCLTTAIGALLAVALELGYFLIHDGGAHLWECTVQFNRYYLIIGGFSLDTFFRRLESFGPTWGIMFLLPLASFLKPPPRLGFWLGIFLCSLIATGASPYAHYYITLMPFWALLCAISINALALRVTQLFTPISQWARCLFTGLCVGLLVQPDIHSLTQYPGQFFRKKYAIFPFTDAKIVAERLAELSSPDDFVFVGGSEPQILVYAQRFSPTRYITTYSLMLPTPIAHAYQLAAIQDLEKFPPAWIVMVRVGNSWVQTKDSPPDFSTFLQNQLDQHYDIIGGYINTPESSRWVEPLSNDDFGDTSLVLYKRKPNSTPSLLIPSR